MSGQLDVYTDASVKGRLLGGKARPKRSRLGPGFIAWAGWHDCSLPDCPTFAGQAFAGHHGTQTAEFQALIHGLAAALAYVEARTSPRRPALVRVHLDNKAVHLIMSGEWRANTLKPHYDSALGLQHRFQSLGLLVDYRKVSEKHKTHKVVHTMSAQAQTQVLVRAEWRPIDQAPGAASPSEPDDDIPF